MRLRTLLRLFALLLLIFVTQKVLFMLYNMGMADGAPFLSCLASLWHGLRLDIATACYLIIFPHWSSSSAFSSSSSLCAKC